MDYSTRKSAKWGVCLLRVTFDLENGPFWPWRPTGSIGKVLTDVQVKFWQKWGQNSVSPKRMVNNSTWKSVKEGVYLPWGLFDLENGSFWPWGPTGSICKVLSDVQVKFLQKWGRNSGSPKNSWTIAHENQQNGGFTCSRDRSTLKIGRLGQLAP